MNSTQQWQNVTWFEVDEHQAGQRIDNFLFSRLKGVPKSRIYRLIREGQVRVNKKRIKAETKLSIGDQIRVAPIRYEQKDENAAPVSDKVAQSLLSRVVYEDEGLMVVNKPSGIAVHGGSGVAYGLIEGLRAATGKKYLELSQIFSSFVFLLLFKMLKSFFLSNLILLFSLITNGKII